MGLALAVPATTYIAFGLSILALVVVAEMARRLLAHMNERLQALEVKMAKDIAEQDERIRTLQRQIAELDGICGSLRRRIEDVDVRRRAETQVLASAVAELREDIDWLTERSVGVRRRRRGKADKAASKAAAAKAAEKVKGAGQEVTPPPAMTPSLTTASVPANANGPDAVTRIHMTLAGVSGSD